MEICHFLENPQRIQTVDHPLLLIFLSSIQNSGNDRMSSEVHIGFSNTASNGVSSVIGPESNHCNALSKLVGVFAFADVDIEKEY